MGVITMENRINELIDEPVLIDKEQYEKAFEKYMELLKLDPSNIDAQYKSIMNHNGDGVGQNYAKAEKWLRLAAEQGKWEAQVELIKLLRNKEE